MLNTELLPIGLLPFDLRSTPLADVVGRSFEDLGEQTFAFARGFLPRVLPLRGADLEEALLDLVVRTRESAALRRCLEECSEGWAGVVMVTAVQVWAHGVIIRGSEVDWDTETLRAAARILRSSNRPAGLVAHADELAETATRLDRLARDADRIRFGFPAPCDVAAARQGLAELPIERRRPNDDSDLLAESARLRIGPSRGRPIDPATALFARLEGPLPSRLKGLRRRPGMSKTEVPKAERARLAAGLLTELAGEQADWKAILASDKASRARGRKRAPSHVSLGD